MATNTFQVRKGIVKNAGGAIVGIIFPDPVLPFLISNTSEEGV